MSIAIFVALGAAKVPGFASFAGQREQSVIDAERRAAEDRKRRIGSNPLPYSLSKPTPPKNPPKASR